MSSNNKYSESEVYDIAKDIRFNMLKLESLFSRFVGMYQESSLDKRIVFDLFLDTLLKISCIQSSLSIRLSKELIDNTFIKDENTLKKFLSELAQEVQEVNFSE